MKLVGKPLPAKGLVAFDWSPSTESAVLAYWAPEEDANTPARVVILDPVARTELRSKNLFNVSTVRLHWSPYRGEFLCAQVLRHSKTGKTSFTNFEVFRVRDADIPNETLTMNEAVEAFAFEPVPDVPLPTATAGSANSPPRFAVVHAGRDGKSTDVSFFSLDAAKGGEKVERVLQLEARPANQIHWSPAGGVVLLAGLDNLNGQLEFYDVDERVSLATAEHFMCNEVAWDPSGRVVVTVHSQPMFGEVAVRYTLENGYKVWSFQGAKLREQPLNDFYQFLWRPHPKPVLSEAEVEDVRKKLAQHARRFEREDAMLRRRRQAAADEERVRKLVDFRGLMADRRAVYLEQLERRRQLGIRWGADVAAQGRFVETTEAVEDVVSEKVERL